MLKIEFYDILESAFRDINLDFNEKKYDLFNKYLNLILEWNEKMNLTSITDKKDIVQKHFIDSIKIFKFELLLKMRNIIDIGTGAGFPGIPMKIADENINLTLVDSTLKKVNFLREAVSLLKLDNCIVFHGRAENMCKNLIFREKYDAVVSRAVANLNLLSEICLPLVKKGGYFIALKGPSIYDELKIAGDNIDIFGGKINCVKEVLIEDSEYKHNILIIEKVKNTPDKYPRNPKLIGKNICFT